MRRGLGRRRRPRPLSLDGPERRGERPTGANTAPERASA
jgi:hypothetical protein